MGVESETDKTVKLLAEKVFKISLISEINIHDNKYLDTESQPTNIFLVGVNTQVSTDTQC